MISASLVKELREQTGAGMMDCKKALSECNGDLEKAVDWLREKGIAKAGKKEARIAAEEVVEEVVEEVAEETVVEDLSAKTLTELKAMAKTAGIKGYSTMKKDELIASLSE